MLYLLSSYDHHILLIFTANINSNVLKLEVLKYEVEHNLLIEEKIIQIFFYYYYYYIIFTMHKIVLIPNYSTPLHI